MKCAPRLLALAIAVLLLAELGAGAASGQSPAATELDRRTAETLSYNGRRLLSSTRHSPWQIFHGVLGVGGDLQIQNGSGTSRAVDFLCNEATVGGRRLFFRTAHGLEPIYAHEGEGHPDQFLAILAQADVPLNQKIQVDGATFTVADLVSQAQAEYCAGREASWTLIALSTYLPINATWTNQSGQSVTIADLVAAEVATDPQSAPCGGTHNLHALAYALSRSKAAGAPRTLVWQQAETKLAEHVRLARAYQNRDGSFSSNYFSGPGSAPDAGVLLYSTGHMLEWLLLYLPDLELEQPWITGAVEAILRELDRAKNQTVDCGTLYHACHALRLYQQRRSAKNVGGRA